jgi:hypothetical protein
MSGATDLACIAGSEAHQVTGSPFVEDADASGTAQRCRHGPEGSRSPGMWGRRSFSRSRGDPELVIHTMDESGPNRFGTFVNKVTRSREGE